MNVAVLFSGGKDSCYAIWLLQHQAWEVAKLVTVKPSSSDSWMFHVPNLEWTGLQAQAMGIKHDLVVAGEDEIAGLEEALARIKRDDGIQGIATGAVASDYQRSRFDRVCDSVDLKSYSPLWHKKPESIISDLVSTGFKIVLSAVSASGLDEAWLGRELSVADWVKLEELSRRHGIHLSGEGGEYETFVVDAPHFAKEVVIEESKKVFRGQSGRLEITSASLRDKTSDGV